MKRILSIIFLFLALNTYSQTIVSGDVLDSLTLVPLEYASVRLFKAEDSTVAYGIYTDEKGKFELDNVSSGEYYLVISYTGLSPKTIKDISLKGQPVYLIGKVGLSNSNAQQIEEVKVTANVDLLKTGIDKKIYNVDQDLSTRGGSADDVLNNIPSVEVDQDGNIALRGDGNVTILIDGRPSTLTGGADGSFLDAIPASSIERIEVVTNPSAKYDPDGTSGIINIVLKKNKLKGFNGQLSATAGTGHDHNANASISFRNSKFNVYLSYGFDYYAGYRNNFGTLEQRFGNDSIARLDQDRQGTDLNYGHTIRVGSDFYINNQNTIGFSLTGNTGFRERTGDQDNQLFNADGTLISQWERISQDPTSNENFDANINFEHLLKKEKGKWSFNFTQSMGNRENSGFYNQSYSLYNLQSNTADPIQQEIYSNGGNDIFTGQFDFEYIIDKWKARVETGAKMILRNEDLDASSYTYDYSLNDFALDTLANYRYLYDENVYSAYGVFGQQFGKFKYQIGLRGEVANQTPQLVNENTDYSKTYMNLFPSGHLRYNVSKITEVSLSYSRRINRPSSRTLNPFTNYSDPYNLRRGNPNLNSEYIDSYDLGISIEKKVITLSANIFYRHTEDVIQRVKRYYEDNTSATTWDNINESNSGGLELIVIVKPTKWWRNTLSWNGNYVEFKDNGTQTNWNNNGYNWSLKYTGRFDFWKKTASIQLNGRFSAPRTTAQGKVEPWTYFDISGEKSFLDKKWTVGFRFSDVFNTKGFKYTVDQTNVYQESEFKWLTRRAYLTLTYKFGKLEFKSGGFSGEGGGFDF